MPGLKTGMDFTGQVSENGCEKWHYLVWNRVRIWRTWRHINERNFILMTRYCPDLVSTSDWLINKVRIKRKKIWRRFSCRKENTVEIVIASYILLSLTKSVKSLRNNNRREKTERPFHSNCQRFCLFCLYCKPYTRNKKLRDLQPGGRGAATSVDKTPDNVCIN